MLSRNPARSKETKFDYTTVSITANYGLACILFQMQISLKSISSLKQQNWIKSNIFDENHFYFDNPSMSCNNIPIKTVVLLFVILSTISLIYLALAQVWNLQVSFEIKLWNRLVYVCTLTLKKYHLKKIMEMVSWVKSPQ